MALPEAYTANDGYAVFFGCNTHQSPKQLQHGYYSKGLNVSVRGGAATTRDGFDMVAKLGDGEFQGAARYALDEAEYLVYAIGGKVFVLAGTTPVGIGGSLKASGQVHFTQVYRWMVCQDGESRPIVIEESGGSFARVARDAVRDPSSANPKICLVPGTVGVYAHGRYHYVPTKLPSLLPELALNSDKTAYTNLDTVPEIEDETGRASVTSSDVLDIYVPAQVFRLSEHRVLNEGAAFSVPAELGFIKGMGMMRGAATGTGIGAVYVFCSRGVASFDFASPRTEWKNVAISQVAFTGPGTRSPRSIFNVNDDLWYVGTTGHLRSVGYDVAQLSGGGNAAPALFNRVRSIEADRWVKMNLKEWIPEISGCHADNRLHWTLANGKAVGSVELAQAYDANPSELPVLHEGAYVGFDFLQVLSLEDKLHAVVRSGTAVHLLKLGGKTDLGTPIRSEIVTRMMPFVYNEAASWRELKRFIDLHMYVSGVDRGTLFEVDYRSDYSSAWTRLGEYYVNVPEGSAPQGRRIVFAADTTLAECDPATGSPPWMFRFLQLRIVWTGRASIDRISANAAIQSDMPEPMCVDDNPGNASAALDVEDDFAYYVPIGGL